MSKTNNKLKAISPVLRETSLDIEDSNGKTFANGGPFNTIEFEDPYSKTESPLILFLCPVFVFLRWIGLTHYRFQFDQNSQTFICHSGSSFRKVICILIQALTITHSFAQQQIVGARVRSSTIYAMHKLMSIAYIAFAFSFFHAMMTKGKNFQDIFTLTQATTSVIRRAGCAIPCHQFAKRMSIGILLFYLTFSFVYTSAGVDGGEQGIWRAEKVSKIIPSLANQFIRCYLYTFTCKNMTEINSYSMEEDHSFFLLVLLAIYYSWVEWMVCMAWIMAFLMTTVFGIMFWKVLNNFFVLVGKSAIRNTLEDLRKFNWITGIIDLYNIAFGCVTLTGVITASVHFSVYIVEMFKASVPIHLKICIGWSFLLFGMTLFSAAQVNNKASEIVDVLKLRFQTENIWKEYHGNCVETTQGILLVQHEVSTNKIGFRGLGFFTVTYAFLGTVLSVISTYSVVVMQYQNN